MNTLDILIAKARINSGFTLKYVDEILNKLLLEEPSLSDTIQQTRRVMRSIASNPYNIIRGEELMEELMKIRDKLL